MTQSVAVAHPAKIPVTFTVVDEPDLPPEAESEVDAQIAAEKLKDAVVFGTDWTAGTILDQLKQKNIDLTPAFQRRDAWDSRRKSRFIESVMLGFPIPQIVLAEHADSRGRFIVIDGKQRLLSLQQFAGINLPPGKEPLRLSGLEVRKDLVKKTFADLNLTSEIHAFLNQTIRTVVVRNWRDERVLYQIFYRLNSNSVALSPQELRQALIPGPFLTFAAIRAGESAELRRIWKSPTPDFRMRDVELFVRHFAFRRQLSAYSGNLREFLDTACKELNSAWPSEEENIRQQADDLDGAISMTYDVFGDNAFQSWEDDHYRGRFNRAVFDIMTHFFAEKRPIKISSAMKAKLEMEFKRLCRTDEAFLHSLETTTKSKNSVEKRFSTWSQALKRARFASA